jgi:hypothetical protein
MNQVIDRIVKLLASGLNRDEVYKDIHSKCTLSVQTKSQKQQLADLIAQIDSRSVFAVGIIPTEERRHHECMVV